MQARHHQARHPLTSTTVESLHEVRGSSLVLESGMDSEPPSFPAPAVLSPAELGT